MKMAEYEVPDGNRHMGRPADYTQNKVNFYTKEVLNRVKSDEAGEDVKEQREYVRVQVPGSTNIFDNLATDQHRKRYPAEYAAFKRGGEQTPDGTPIYDLPGLLPAQAGELDQKGVQTIEQIAAMPEHQAAKLGRGYEDVQRRARKFVEQINSNDALRKEIDELKALVAAQATAKPKATAKRAKA